MEGLWDKLPADPPCYMGGSYSTLCSPVVFYSEFTVFNEQELCLNRLSP